jgi:hypothetical protein
MPPGSVSCPDACTGGCTPDNVCKVDCDGEKKCEGDMIVCPPDYACEVTCGGLDSCDTSNIQCASKYACTLICKDGKDACGDVLFACDGASSCEMQCMFGPDDQACQGATVICGAGACAATCDPNVVPPDFMNCNEACSCEQC